MAGSQWQYQCQGQKIKLRERVIKWYRESGRKEHDVVISRVGVKRGIVCAAEKEKERERKKKKDGKKETKKTDKHTYR